MSTPTTAYAPRAVWSAEQLMVLTQLYASTQTTAVALQLGKTLDQVYRKAASMGLKKSDEYLQSELARRLRKGHSSGLSTRFAPGQTPWNSGKKGLMIGGIETQFKPGSKPHNHAPIGSYRLDAQGNLQRKISDAPGSNSRRWRGVHELVWVDANGPVPPKHIVAFKLGQRTAALEEITLDRVECITLADNMRRNSVHARLPKELAELVQLCGAIQRQINKRSQHNEQ